MDATRQADDAGRIDSLDVLRGVAVLGILLMNIVVFALPSGAMNDPTRAGGTTPANLGAWLVTSVFFEGTMRGLFTLLFGAGVVLFTSRAERTSPTLAADLHVRRMLWLVAFAFVNSHVLLWEGDILFEYGLVGLVLYAFRKARPRTLLIVAALCFAALLGRGIVDASGLQQLRADAAAATAAQQAGATLSESQQAAIDDWQEQFEEARPPPEKVREQVDAMRGSFADVWLQVTPTVRWWRTEFLYEYGFLESFGTMLLGIALFAAGALQGRWSPRAYWVLALSGYAVGLTVNAAEAVALVRSDYDVVVEAWTGGVTYQLGRVPTLLGHVGLILLVWRSGVLAAALHRLAAVGRMAFTNYMTQSLFGMLLFTGVGFGLYDRLERHELYYVVAAIWAVQLLVSPWWLARFSHGPLEWLWRSLTYGEWQSIRKSPRRSAPAAA